ncbi:MAG: glycoside hydrolase family 75 protein [Akkermansiaceae bacterium]
MGEKNIKRSEPRRGVPWFGVSFLILVIALVGSFFTDIPKKVSRNLKDLVRSQKPIEEIDRERIELEIADKLRMEMEKEFQLELQRQLAEVRTTQEARAVTDEVEDNTPEPFVPLPIGKVTDVRKLRNGIPFKTEITFGEGGIASVERKSAESYVASYELQLKLPTPAKTIGELEASNSQLSKILPSLPDLLEGGKVSHWFNQLYTNKSDRIRKKANSLNELLSKHNVYDCETILNLQAENGRKVLLLQAEMDVVSDGSDGDRLPEMPDSIVNSTYYQPFTSYGWTKRGNTPNPMIAGFERRIVNANREIAESDTTAERKKWLKERVTMLKRWISDLKARSYLIAEYDPFIVMPVNLITDRKDPYSPRVGDYAVVIHEDKIYPCIVGDGGPTFKVGEASLRMAKEINERSSPYSRPVSDLTVTYIVFPKSREDRNGPPDYDDWRQQCHELLQEIGGLGSGYELHQWKNLLPEIEPEEDSAGTETD